MIKSCKIYGFILVFSLLSFSCQSPTPKSSNLAPEVQSRLINHGKVITLFSFKAFTRELTKAINEGGVKHAVDYCQTHANPIIDSLSAVYKVKISRISDKYRNPSDKPDEVALSIIENYKKLLADGKELLPHLEINGADTVFYSPIIILNPLCLNCHGEPGSTMETENYNYIKSRYPDDRAYGYKLGDLRGVWKIVFNF
jgi:hypothetical protein